MHATLFTMFFYSVSSLWKVINVIHRVKIYCKYIHYATVLYAASALMTYGMMTGVPGKLFLGSSEIL